ncbi:MAG: hypothetical protein ACOX0C_01440 [Patescibacteria group bacterium]
MKKFLFWFAVAERRQAETHLIILDFVQKKLEFQPKGTAKCNFRFRKEIGHWGNGDYEVKLEKEEEIEQVFELIKQSYTYNK